MLKHPYRLLVQDFCLQLTKVTPPPQHIHVVNTGHFSNTASQLMTFALTMLFTFLTTEASDSSFWKFLFEHLISAVSEFL